MMAIPLVNMFPYFYLLWLNSPRHVYTSVTELCLFKHYGGWDKGNYGGVCRALANAAVGQREMDFPDYLKSPRFTLDYYDGDIFGRLSFPILESMCSALCSCEGEDPDKKKSRKRAWEKLQNDAADKHSDEYRGE